MALVDSGRPAAMARVMLAIVLHIERHGTCVADDISAALPDVLEAAPAVFGSAFNTLSRREVIAHVGWDVSHRKARHAGATRRWGKGDKWEER